VIKSGNETGGDLARRVETSTQTVVGRPEAQRNRFLT